jgi:hypothetical protein
MKQHAVALAGARDFPARHMAGTGTGVHVTKKKRPEKIILP